MLRTSESKKRAHILSVSLLVAGVSLLATVTVFKILGRSSSILYIWPVSGIQMAFLLRRWNDRRVRIRGQAAGIIGVFLGCQVVGMPGWFAASVSVVTALDVWIAATILSRGVTCFEDLKRSENLLRLVAAATIAPIVAGSLNAFSLAIFLHESLLRAFQLSVLCDSLGIAIVFPAALLVFAGRKRSARVRMSSLTRALPPGLAFAAVAALVFWQNSNPLLFMVFPPMVIMVLLTGLEGSVYVSVTLAAIACYGTAHHHGPLWLSHKTTPEHQVLLLQMYLWMSTATALPIGAMLDERRKAEKDATEARFLYRTLLQNADDMIILSSLDGSQRYVSAACERLTGWTSEEYMALDRMSTFHPDDRHIVPDILELMKAGKLEHVFRYRIAQKCGEWRWVEAHSRVYLDDSTGSVKGYVGTVRDISHHVATEAEWHEERTTLDRDKQEMAKLARTDALTGLPNRLCFDEALQEHAGPLRRIADKLVVMMIDVDDFKKYNDAYGHQAGDDCLRSIASALAACALREKDIVARWGGEEFAVLLPGSDILGAEKMAERILETVRGLQIPHGCRPSGFASVSIGAAELCGPTGIDITQVVSHADSALYASKRNGKDRFTPALPLEQESEHDQDQLQFNGS